METMVSFLPILVYILLIVLLIFAIVLVVKTINTMNKIEEVVDNVNEKVTTLNPVFSLIDKTTDTLSGFTDRIVEFATAFIGRLLINGKKKRKKGEEDE